MAMQLTKVTGLTQAELADELNISRSLVGMIETGRRKLPDYCEPSVARMSFKMALQIAEERSGGYISNLLADIPGIDLHPAALKERLITELEEALGALEALKLSKMDPIKKKEFIEEAIMEIEDVVDVANVLKGAYAEEFGIDLHELNKKRREQIRHGER